MKPYLPLITALAAGCSAPGTTNVYNTYGAAAGAAGSAGTAASAGAGGQEGGSGGAGGAAPAECCLSKASSTTLENGLKVTVQVAPLSACACHLPCPYWAGYRSEEEIVSRSPSSYDGGPVTQFTVDEFDGAEYVRTESLDASGTLLFYSQTVSQLVPACS